MENKIKDFIEKELEKFGVTEFDVDITVFNSKEAYVYLNPIPINKRFLIARHLSENLNKDKSLPKQIKVELDNDKYTNSMGIGNLF